MFGHFKTKTRERILKYHTENTLHMDPRPRRSRPSSPHRLTLLHVPPRVCWPRACAAARAPSDRDTRPRAIALWRALPRMIITRRPSSTLPSPPPPPPSPIRMVTTTSPSSMPATELCGAIEFIIRSRWRDRTLFSVGRFKCLDTRSHLAAHAAPSERERFICVTSP